MATTSSRLAVAALDAMRSAGVTFALLHGAERFSEERLSDVDVVTDRDATSVISASAADWWERGLRPVVSWPYDLGGTSVFLSTRDASDGVQLDLMFDPGGRGTYGLRSPALLATAAVEDGLQQVSPEATLLYQWRKRTAKGQHERLRELREGRNTIDRDGLLVLSEALTGSAEIAREILGELPPGSVRQPLHPGRELSRLFGRARRPIGFWAHASSREIAVTVSSRFGRFLVSTSSTKTPPPVRQPVWWLRKVLPFRLLPSLVMSWGRLPAPLAPDAVLRAQQPDEAATELTAVMAARFG